MKNLAKHAFHLLPVIGLGICMFLYPNWWIEGYLDTLYVKIGAGISVYGGFIASLIWYIQNRKGL